MVTPSVFIITYESLVICINVSDLIIADFTRSYFTNATDEMKGMKGKKIIGNVEYGMSPRDVYDVGDSLNINQCVDISSEKFKPLKKIDGMFDNNLKLYGVQLKYYYAWGDEKIGMQK